MREREGLENLRPASSGPTRQVFSRRSPLSRYGCRARGGTRISCLCICLTLSSLLGACDKRETRKEEAFPLRRQVADTTLVLNHYSDHPDTARMVELIQITKREGPADFLMWTVSRITVGWRGELYVTDDSGIRVFSPDGSSVRYIARNGQGPGEVLTVTGMAVDSLGRLMAVDETNRRVAVLDTSGAVIDHWRLPNGRPGYGLRAITPIPGGQSLLAFFPPVEPPDWRQKFPRPVFLRLDRNGEILDTVFVPLRLHEDCPFEEDGRYNRGPLGDGRIRYVPKVTWTASRQGSVIFGCPTKYEFESIDPSGGVLRASLDKPPVKSNPEEIDWIMESMEKVAESVGRSWKWSGPLPPENLPYFSRILIGRYGRIWVWPEHPGTKQVVQGQEVWRPTWTGAFDVFEADGTYRGSVALPEGARFRSHPALFDPFIAGDTVWLLRFDSLDVPAASKMLVEWEK